MKSSVKPRDGEGSTASYRMVRTVFVNIKADELVVPTCSWSGPIRKATAETCPPCGQAGAENAVRLRRDRRDWDSETALRSSALTRERLFSAMCGRLPASC